MLVWCSEWAVCPAHSEHPIYIIQTVMHRVEQRLALTTEKPPDNQAIQEEERAQLLALTEQLAEPELRPQARLSLVAVMRVLLGTTAPVEWSSASVGGDIQSCRHRRAACPALPMVQKQ